jgi:hypothetical protein
MGMMIVRHKVKDYGQWRPMFDAHVEAQRAAGLINPRVYHSADSNKSEIFVVFDTDGREEGEGIRCICGPQGSDDEGWGFGHPDYLFP